MILSKFTHTGTHLSLRQRRQQFCVTDNTAWLPKGAHEVFPFREIDPGLTSNCCVDLAEECSRDVQHPDSAMVNGGSEARYVGNHTATYPHNKVTSCEASLRKRGT